MNRLILRTSTVLRTCAPLCLSPTNSIKGARILDSVSSSNHLALASSSREHYRFYSNDSGSQIPESTTLAERLGQDDSLAEVKDVPTKEFNDMVEKFLENRDDDDLPDIMDAAISRRLSKKHEDTDDDILDKMERPPVYHGNDEEYESDFEKLHETDEEIENIYDARGHVVKKLLDDEFFNVDDKMWDGMITEMVDAGYLKDTKELEELLEDMLHWDKLLPAEIKESVEKKVVELEAMCDRGELQLEDAYEIFKEFEDEILSEYGKKMDAEECLQSGVATVSNTKKVPSNVPPGDGPILRWQTRVVFTPGGDAWHPKNRKVKLSVTVKELGLSKNQFRRLRELVGKRYDAGRGELTVTSERFEHREENRKDCLRTLFALLEEAGKADKLAEDARVSYVKERLKANPGFMERLRDKTKRQAVPV